LRFVDEAFWAGNKKGESVLKGLITERTLAIEHKGFDVVQLPNMLHVLMAANAEWVVPASHDERRFVVLDVSNKYAQGAIGREQYFSALFKELENGGVEAMLYDLLHYDLGDWHPRQIYETEGLRRQKERSLAPLEQWFYELLYDGRLPGPLIAYSGISYITAATHGAFGKPDCATTRDLVDDALKRVPRLRNYLSDKAMGDFLRRWGCVPTRSNEARGWQFPPRKQMRVEWERKYGPQAWDDDREEAEWH
jgi:hypothetical protein